MLYGISFRVGGGSANSMSSSSLSILSKRPDSAWLSPDREASSGSDEAAKGLLTDGPIARRTRARSSLLSLTGSRPKCGLQLGGQRMLRLRSDSTRS